MRLLLVRRELVLLVLLLLKVLVLVLVLVLLLLLLLLLMRDLLRVLLLLLLLQLLLLLEVLLPQVFDAGLVHAQFVLKSKCEWENVDDLLPENPKQNLFWTFHPMEETDKLSPLWPLLLPQWLHLH